MKDAHLFHGVHLDAWIYPTSYLEKVPDDALRFSESILALDKRGQGASYLAAVQERLAQKPEALSQADRNHLIQWIHKMVTRVELGHADGNYRRAWLHFELLEAYFKLRTLWFLGDKKSFAYLKEHDRKAYELFIAAYSDLHNDEYLKRLVTYVTDV